MASVVSSAAKEEPDPVVKPAEEKRKRLPRSVCKHVRHAKTALRHEHTSGDAEKAIEQTKHILDVSGVELPRKPRKELTC